MDPLYDLDKLSDTQSVLMYHSVLKVKNCRLEFFKLNFKVATVCVLPQSSCIYLQNVVIC